ncbi:lysoplasmalogenase family protein, partial [Erwinia amylovora]|uniref:lysoplasmalogenase family protein n=1 Tax=Erwinia amylovora TaxID=552 RepID=UPI00200B9235
LIIGALVIATVWTRLEELRWPISTFIGMARLMVWLSTEQYFVRPSDDSFTLMVGADLLLLGNIVCLISHFRRRFSADSAMIAACYF